jgi:hypothetical protein
MENEAWQEKMAVGLARFAGLKQTETGDDWLEQLALPTVNNTASLSIYRVPDQTPLEFYARFAAIRSPAAGHKVFKDRYDSTLIALIEI